MGKVLKMAVLILLLLLILIDSAVIKIMSKSKIKSFFGRERPKNGCFTRL